ncbi:MAG: ABC transporter substrate-binding protein [Deltaproteobacteria bacterium]|nr:ABC transporter substrate-binding protein [Deltaproteobacteria bacterium]MBW1995396.1 ABC transporter substrate-binding protein [Deltaproteobacteria bacterium]MBW2150217.1 ABC transporter substrate-binding protein [Deltaproteobacteria bacterium]
MVKKKNFILVSPFVTISFLLLILSAFYAGPAIAGGGPIELRIGWMMHIPSLDPVNQSNNWEYTVATNVYDTLVYPDPAPDKLCKPWIAESWKISADAKTYTFYLRKGVKFHDGSEVTAEDVAFSMDRQQTLGGPIAARFKSIKPQTTEVIDKYTVAFHLEKPDPSFMATLFVFKILNKKQVLENKQPGKYGEFGDYGVKWLDTHDAGSGPYRVVKRLHGDRVVLEKFKDYSLRQWKENSIDRVIIYITPELVTIATKLRKGEIDLSDWTLPPKTMRELDKFEGINVYYDRIDTSWFLILNNKKPPLDCKYVRKAMAYAFDYDVVINDILVGGKRSQGPVPIGIPGHNDKLLTYTRDLEKAKQLLAKSKYSKQELAKFEMELAAVAGSERFHNIGLLAAANFSEIGLKVKVRDLRWADICQHQAKSETAFHIVIFYQSGTVPHPQPFLLFYTPEGWGTAYPPGGIYYENPKVTEYIEKAKAAASLEEQYKYYKMAQELIVEDSPCLFLHNTLLAQPIWRYVKGYKMPAGAFYYQLRFDTYWMDVSDKYYKQNHGTR